MDFSFSSLSKWWAEDGVYFMAVVVLAVIVIFTIYRLIVVTRKRMFDREPDYQEALAGDYEGLDQAFYAKNGLYAAGLGMFPVVDYVDRSAPQDMALHRTPFRVLVSPAGDVVLSIHHRRLRGSDGLLTAFSGQQRDFKGIELETAFDNGEYLITTNAEDTYDFEGTEWLNRAVISNDSKLSLLVAWHRVRLGAYLIAHPEVKTLEIKLASDVFNYKRVMLERVADVLRKRSWRITKCEIQREREKVKPLVILSTMLNGQSASFISEECAEEVSVAE